ncbi:8175_t:CDS:2 [Dentiscutata erythropus]|uniref:8175_t:CDS:1 n=1 Tax=Dentiscutata erythropus TaxID=1348616 RepID=A0A9N9FXH5_9GLOM|nr:8175_t:CDS:2 [Dentiscutata erythropus]
MKNLQQEQDLNPFVDTYIFAENEDLQDSLYYILIHNKHGKDMRQYNTPLAEEIAAICFSDETMHVRDILIVRHNNELERISKLYGAYNPLAYPLLFLHGEYAQHPKASKTSEAEAGASDISNIDFDTLLERESQSETGLTSVLESTTIRSSSRKKRAREETEEIQAQAEDYNDLYNPIIKKKLYSSLILANMSML